MSEKLETIIWIITGYCNLRCPYCYASNYSQETPLPLSQVKKVIDEAAGLGVEYIQFTGGEPLLRKDITEILEYTSRLGIETSVFSNLTIMSEKVASRLAEIGVTVYTSLDGPKEVYEAVKGKGAWSRFLRGLELVKSKGLWLHINIPLSKINYNRAGEALRLAIELGADSVSAIPSMPSGRALSTRSFISAKELMVALRQLEEVASEYGISLPVWCTPFLGVVKWAKHLRWGNCRNWNVMDITPSGKVVLCDVLYKVVADVTRDGVSGAWEKLRQHPLYKTIFETPSECRSCGYAAACRGGCYARAFYAFKRLPAPDPLCPLIASKYPRQGQ
jgi:radical SAM protein with 4Fe4S-binding SPASM domain